MDYQPSSPYAHCESVLEFRLDKDETLTGPFYSVVVPGRTVTLQVDAGMTLRGPILITLCDGHLIIGKP